MLKLHVLLARPPSALAASLRQMKMVPALTNLLSNYSIVNYNRIGDEENPTFAPAEEFEAPTAAELQTNEGWLAELFVVIEISVKYVAGAITADLF